MTLILRFLGYWLAPVLTWVFWRAFALIGLKFAFTMAVMVAVIQLVPVPDWLTGLPAQIASLPPSVFYFADLIHLQAGVGIILGAAVTRFVLRRLLAAINQAGS